MLHELCLKKQDAFNDIPHSRKTELESYYMKGVVLSNDLRLTVFNRKSDPLRLVQSKDHLSDEENLSALILIQGRLQV